MTEGEIPRLLTSGNLQPTLHSIVEDSAHDIHLIIVLSTTNLQSKATFNFLYMNPTVFQAKLFTNCARDHFFASHSFRPLDHYKFL